jgi:hypothetical protein
MWRLPCWLELSDQLPGFGSTEVALGAIDMNSRARTFAIWTVLWLLVSGQANAHDHRWYDVPAAGKSIADQVIAISRTKEPFGVMFAVTPFWDSPARHNVYGWFTPQEALCLALDGTPMTPVPLSSGNFTFMRPSDHPEEPQHCEYATVDWGPEWIHPPQADWK